MQPQAIDYVTRALLQVLPQHLQPYVEVRLREQGIEESWQRAFTARDRERGRRGMVHEITDPAVQLKLLHFRVSGRPLIPVDDEVAQASRAVLGTRNRFAHATVAVDTAEATRVLMEVGGLFLLLELDDALAEIEDLLQAVRDLQADAAPPVDGATSSGAGTGPSTDEDAGADPAGAPSPRPAGDAAAALDSVGVGFSHDPRPVHASSVLRRPVVRLGIALTGGVSDLPILRVSVALVVDASSISLASDQVVTLAAGDRQEPEVELVLDRAALLVLDQVTEARVRVTLSAGGVERTVLPEGGAITVHGPRNWRLAPDDGVEHTLAGFVQPQEPALSGLLREADTILAARTGRGGLDAYQGDEERNDAIVDAICRAVHARGLTYANPPAAWAEDTQRIRSAPEVLEERLATCLDSTVLLASLLEQAGIDGQLWLLHGHIFVGYWRTEERRQDPDPHPAPLLLANQIERGALRLVETTMLTAPEYPGQAALHEHAQRAAGGLAVDRIQQVIDIRGARRAGLHPLPVRVVGNDGDVDVVEYAPPTRDLSRLVRESLPGTARRITRDTDVPPRIEAWKRELLDLSLHNRLINLTPRAAYTLSVPTEVQGAFEDMLHAGTSFALEAFDGIERTDTVLAERVVEDHRVILDVAEESYARALQKLANTARTVVEETGSNNLYLTLGTLHWTSDGKDLVSPLVLVPVTIRARARGARYEIALDETGASTPNHSLLQRLAHDLSLSIPGLEDPETDEAGIDLDQAFQSVRNALTEYGLPFRVETRVHLGLFNFGGFRLWKDLEDDWRAVMANPLVRHLVESPSEPFVDPVPESGSRDLDGLVAELPTTADASQALVVSEAVAGRTVVVEGPPGTGKSQTITNLIVQAMVEGRRVLFVAEKQAALEVVSRRLAAAGVSDLVLDLHDVSLRPAAVKRKILSALDLEAEVDEEGLAADRRALEARRGELVHYRDALHARNTAGMSLYTAHTRDLAAGDDVDPLAVPADVVARLDRAAIDRVAQGLAEVTAASRAVTPRPGHPWRLFARPVPAGTEGGLVDALLALRDRVSGTPVALRSVVTGLRSAGEAATLADLLDGRGLPWELIEAIAHPDWETGARGIEHELAALSAQAQVFHHYGPDVIGGPIDQVRAALTEARSARFGKRGRMRRALAPLARWERPGAPVPDELIEQAVNALLTVRDTSVRAAHRISVQPGLAPLAAPALLDPRARAHVAQQLAGLRAARDARSGMAGTDTAAAVERVPHAERGNMSLHLRTVADLWRTATGHAGGTWSTPEGTSPLDHLVTTLGGARADELTPRGLALWSDLGRAVDPLRDVGLGDLAELVLDGRVEPSELSQAFDKGLAQGAVEERRGHGSLRSFDGERHDHLIDGFDALGRRVRDGAGAAVRARILAHRTTGETAESRRLASDLRREVSGRRRAPKVRSLFTRFGSVISRSMPCVLVSPESVARFVPLREPLFDLVVFDEASQITVAGAIGAMGRGTSVVVVGDSRQMPPTRFAQLTGGNTDEEENETVVPDEESILGECVSARVPRHWLSHHYRSRTEELIAFSNRRYYEGRLATFPGPGVAPSVDGTADTPGRRQAGIRLRRVEGTFLRSGAPRKALRTNPVEAEAVVEDVLARFAGASTEPSLGIVTFNMPQRDLIEARLREAGDESVLESLDDPEGLFVKNLENVQGDERDTILFSIGFSANDKGEVPLNFGPLNREGGERRLNVAVTRAREEVLVFASFEPSQLHAERSTSQGLRDLRDYLDLAQRGVSTLADGQGRPGTVDRHREDIAQALRERGLGVSTSLGLSSFRVDLGVGRPDGPHLVAVMLDGVAWAHRGTAVDRDLLPRSVLTGVAGWPAVERVWLLDWMERREAVLDRIAARVEAVHAEIEGTAAEDMDPGAKVVTPLVDDAEAADASTAAPVDEDDRGGSSDGEGPSGSTATAAPAIVPGEPHAVGDVHAVRGRAVSQGPEGPRGGAGNGSGCTGPSGPRDPSSTAPHRPWSPPFHATVADLEAAPTEPDQAHRMQQLLVSLVDAEYPIHRDEAARQVVTALGIKKVRASRRDELWQAVDRSAFHLDASGFVWPLTVATEQFTGYRPRVLRAYSIDQLHPSELRNVMVDVRRAAASGGQDERLRSGLRLLGGIRLTDGIRSALLRADQDAGS